MKKIYIAPIAGVTDYTFRGILEDCTFSFK